MALLYDDNRAADLLSRYRETGDTRLRDAAVEHMRPLVRHIARKFSGREPLEDLESEGLIGLIRAVDRFTPGKGTRFSTFATYLISGAIRHYLRDRGHLIRQPAWLQELNTRVQRTRTELEQKLGREPSVEELAAATNVAEEGIEELLAAQQAARTLRLQAPDDADDDYLEVDPEKIRSRDYVTLSLPIEDRIALEHALEKLKELEKNVLYYFFYKDFNQSEIARKLGISANYTGYLLRNGLKHMRERLPDDDPLRRARPTDAGDSSVIDPVSGTYTREHFERRLAEEISRAQRHAQSVSVCTLRLPSDSRPQMIEAAGSLLRSRTRKADVVGRIGDAEFAVIFPNTDTIAIRVTARLAEHMHNGLRVPVHAASSTFPDGGGSVRELLDNASAGELPYGTPAGGSLAQAALSN